MIDKGLILSRGDLFTCPALQSSNCDRPDASRACIRVSVLDSGIVGTIIGGKEIGDSKAIGGSGSLG